MTTIVDASYVEALRLCPETWSGIRNRARREASVGKWRDSKVFINDTKSFNMSVASCVDKITAMTEQPPCINEIVDAAVAVAIAEIPPIVKFREYELALVVSLLQAERPDLWVGLIEKAFRRYSDDLDLDKHDYDLIEYIRELSIVRDHSDPQRACWALIAGLREVAWN